MAGKECKSINEEEHPRSDYYDWVMIPNISPAESKTGVTFKGSDNEFFKAHNVLVELTKKKGDRFVINGIDISISDNPPNKPASIAVKPKTGLTGKVNLKVFAKNKGGGATIMVTKPRGGDMVHVKTLAFMVVKYLLDNIIAGEINSGDIEKMKKKTFDKHTILFTL